MDQRHAWIPTGERSGLPMLIAATGSVLFVRADEELTVFVELESTLRACGELG